MILKQWKRQEEQFSNVDKLLKPDEKGRNLIPTPGGEQESWIINESGLYNVIPTAPLAWTPNKEEHRERTD